MAQVRSAQLIDPTNRGEYDVILGDSLRNPSAADCQMLNLRYNWKPQNLSARQTATLKRVGDSTDDQQKYRLVIDDPSSDGRGYRYRGTRGQPQQRTYGSNGSLESPPRSLALVYSHDKSAFVLEEVTASLDFDIASAPGKSHSEIHAMPKFKDGAEKVGRNENHVKTGRTSEDDEDEKPDPNNPYDYRHFLAEARAAAENQLGNLTPLGGTLSAMASPIPGPSCFSGGYISDTATHAPNSVSGPTHQRQKSALASSPPIVRSRTPTSHASSRAKAKPQHSAKRKPALSKERISDSDDEISDTITLSCLSATKPTGWHEAVKKPPSYNASPRIEVDEAADLIIDMGSPPPITKRPRLLHDPARTATPKPADRKARRRAGTLDTSNQDDSDVSMPDSNERGADADVEAFSLGSPRTNSHARNMPSISVSRVEPAPQDEDEGDAELAAELEAALEADDEEAGDDGAVGLGITSAAAREDEEESEVSEEE